MVRSWDSLKDLLYSRHNIHYLHLGGAIHLPHGNLDHPSHLTLLFPFLDVSLRASEAQSSREETWASSSMQYLLWLLTKVTTPAPQTETSRPTELKVTWTGGTHFSNVSLWVMLNGTIPFPHYDCWTHGCWLWEKLYHTLDSDLKNIMPLGSSALDLQALAT